MKVFKKKFDNLNCWWCGSNDLTKEHKAKNTDLKLLYGKTYNDKNIVSIIDFRNKDKGKYLQSSGSKHVKFNPSICKSCNNSSSFAFDFAYEKFIKYYYNNKLTIVKSKTINLYKVFGSDWRNQFLNVQRYIAKHFACRIVDFGYKPSKKLLGFINGREKNTDLKIVFQVKSYFFGEIDDPIEIIFLGPLNSINASQNKQPGVITSFSGWYTISNLSWHFLVEDNVLSNRSNDFLLDLDLIDYKDSNALEIEVNENDIERSWANGIEKLEYSPFWGKDKDLDHYQWVKGYPIE